MAKRTVPLPMDARRSIRCAIYTRKSTEEGLDQAFNSLDTQYEACAAYIASQRHERWAAIRARYDDGGFSGGNMDRPALKRLLDDVRSGKVDTIVLYKVDRLTRSLSDFARIVEVLDAAGASFVSVTQPINTTTSMGRLMLNVLLSFAQFEREMTGERIRDKIAASRAKGMWMGGTPPLGYDVSNRKLIVNEGEAKVVRHIFARYVALGSARPLADDLRREGYVTKRHRGRGGVPYQRGALYYLLANPTYIGKVAHKGKSYDGEQAAIIAHALWDQVQILLRENRNCPGRPSRAGRRAVLAGKIIDGEGRPMTPSHTAKGNRRYLYYATHARGLGADAPPAWRLPARQLEDAVFERITAFLQDQRQLTDHLGTIDARTLAVQFARAGREAGRLNTAAERSACVDAIVSMVRIEPNQITIEIDVAKMGTWLGGEKISSDNCSILLVTQTTKLRQGKDVRLLVGPSDRGAPNAPLIELLAEAHRAWDAALREPHKSAADLAVETGRCRHRMAKLLRIAQLAPDIIQRCVEGTQPVRFTTATLFSSDIPAHWKAQRQQFEFN